MNAAETFDAVRAFVLENVEPGPRQDGITEAMDRIEDRAWSIRSWDEFLRKQADGCKPRR